MCVDECAHGHKLCAGLLPSESDPPLPTRLVDCTDPAHPRLATTDGSRGQYVTLSYVWGEDQPHRTTTSNISTYTAGIDASRLPQTIRDAIHVTHALDVQYLWADSLCIIQDSTEDKQRELGRMHLVYRHAYVTIVAANARKVSEGFLQVRPAPPREDTFPFICPPPRPPTPAEHPIPNSSASTPQVGTVHISPTSDPGRGYDLELYNINSEPISARGWCLQEYFLSPRALIFTSETLQFRCRTATHNVGDSYYEPKHERRLPDMLFHSTPPRLEPGTKGWLSVHAGWTTLVKDYTRRTVGVPSDKLVACGALAQEFQRVLSSDYLVGLWRTSLLHDLLWSVDEFANVQTSRPAAFRAPSWSWAAINGEVLTWDARPRNTANEYEHWTAIAEVVHCEVTPEVPDLPFARVTGGSLVLRAPAMRCAVRSGTHGLSCIPVPYRPRERDWEGGVPGVKTDLAVADQRYGGRASMDTIADAEIQEAWVVPLLRSDRSQWVQGLVVVSVGSDGSEMGSRQVFRRIGHMGAGGKLADALRAGRVPLIEVELV